MTDGSLLAGVPLLGSEILLARRASQTTDAFRPDCPTRRPRGFVTATRASPGRRGCAITESPLHFGGNRVFPGSPHFAC